MIEPIFQTDNYQLARKLLDASVLRQEALATNIANVAAEEGVLKDVCLTNEQGMIGR